VAARLAALRERLAADNRFRLSVVGNDPAARRELLEWAGHAMRLSGLTVLELHDSSGRILSSGHFRNEYDEVRPAPPPTPALVRVRTAEGPVLALARTDSLSVAGRKLTLMGGIAPARALRFPVDDPDLSLRLLLPADTASLPRPDRVAGEIALPFMDFTGQPTMQTARIVVVQSGATLAGVRRSVNAWSLGALAATTALGLAAAVWLAARVSQPLRSLAARTEAIDFDRLDQDFPAERDDEIGALARVLTAMTGRLRAGAVRLREAERRIATGDVARQVNHDIKNGLAPIRNVLRHLDEVASEDSAKLAAVYGERRATLDSSVAYLDTLARNYARLSPAMGREPCDLNAVVEEVVRSVPAGQVEVRAETSAGLPAVPGDRLALRRILENLVGNAVDSGGQVVVSTAEAAREGAPGVRVTVADSGRGMTRAELDRAFDDFYTTKDGGTGLGLSIVRRLVLDLGGAIRVDTAPGEGTRVTIDLPAGTGGGGTA
jgi:signal transduction histidine kinase